MSLQLDTYAWSDSVETLVPAPIEERFNAATSSAADGTDHLTLSTPQTAVLSFDTDRQLHKTTLKSRGSIFYTFSTIPEPHAQGDRGGFVTQLANHHGTTVASHVVPSKGNEVIVIGSEAPIKKNVWLVKGNLFSKSCGKFKHQERWYKWSCIDEPGKLALVLRDQSSPSSANVARFIGCRRYKRPDGRSASRKAYIELNTEYRHMWDLCVFSLIVSQMLCGGAPPAYFAYEGDELVSRMAGWAGFTMPDS